MKKAALYALVKKKKKRRRKHFQIPVKISAPRLREAEIQEEAPRTQKTGSSAVVPRAHLLLRWLLVHALVVGHWHWPSFAAASLTHRRRRRSEESKSDIWVVGISVEL